MDISTVIEYKDKSYKFGFHITKECTISKTISSVVKADYSAMQIFITNPRSKYPPSYDLKDIKFARNLLNKSKTYMCVHGSLLYNLCGSVDHKKDPKFNEKIDSTSKSLLRELDICAALGVGVVVHIGSCKDKKEGIKTICQLINTLLVKVVPDTGKIAKSIDMSVSRFIKKRKIILENAAGEGNKIGSTIEEIGLIMDGLDKEIKNQVKICIDTAHAYGAGIYDWGKVEEVHRFYKDFEDRIGLKYLEVFHLNDSRISNDKRFDAPFGSRKDRHANLGFGYMFFSNEGQESLREFLLLARKHRIAMISEVPYEEDINGELTKVNRDLLFVYSLLLNTDYPMVEHKIINKNDK